MITKNEIINITNLSKLYLTQDELDDFLSEMTGMIKFVDQLDNISNTNNLENNNISLNNIKNAWREDIIHESYKREKIFQNVNNGKDGFFYLEKFK